MKRASRPAAVRDAGMARVDLEGCALAYVVLPNVIFLAGWIAWPLGPVAAALLLICTFSMMRRERSTPASRLGALWVVIVPIAVLWVVLGGLGHFVYANLDWRVRDAVLVDLVRERWPVVYAVDGVSMLLHAPVGYFLPAAAVGDLLGKAFGPLHGVAIAGQALLLWTALGVSMTFALMLRDRPALRPALVRIAVFVVFSGMDIVGTVTHYKPYAVGDHLEWWAYIFQYSSQTTQLFWVPNHALPGWIAIAWLLGRAPDRASERLAIGPAILFVASTPLWSPLTALGLAPIVAALVLRDLATGPLGDGVRRLLDWRIWIPVVVTAALVCPYLVAGTERIAAMPSADMRWVGEDIVPRYIEFVLLEFAGFAWLLLRRDPRDLALWVAVAILLALPWYHYGVWNDLAMRASIPPLTLIAIRLGTWLSTRSTPRDRVARGVAIALLVVGAATPFMEFARAFIEVPRPMNESASVIDVIRGAHYITPFDQPWIERFMRHPATNGR